MTPFDPFDVDDVVQESYLRVWKARTTRPIESAKAFLFTVARRLALDFVRRKRRSPFLAVKDSEALFVLKERKGVRTKRGQQNEKGSMFIIHNLT